MQALTDTLLPIVNTINGYLSDYILVFLLMGAGLYFSFKTKFVQVRCFGEGMKRVFGNLTLSGKKHESGMSSFQALATAIAAQVGTGNIVGASGAILTGGPGAIFWMWIIAFFGMATIYAEAVLAQKTRVKNEDGQYLGGPVYYIRTAFQGSLGKFLAAFFAIAIILALGFTGCMVQSNSIGSTFSTAFGVPSWIVGIILVAVCGFIFVGGVQRLASVTEKLVPLMAAVFLLGGVVVLIARIQYVPATFGMGSTPHAHALANVKEPHEQGCVAMIGVFIDTFVVLTLNSLVVICTLYTPDGPLAAGYTGEVVNVLNNTNLAQSAFGVVFGADLGAKFVAVALFFFAFSTILGWNMFGKVNTEYLFGKKGVTVYTIISLIFIFLGTTTSSDLVWALSDMFNQLMVLPNVIGLVGCTALVVSLTKFKK